MFRIVPLTSGRLLSSNFSSGRCSISGSGGIRRRFCNGTDSCRSTGRGSDGALNGSSATGACGRDHTRGRAASGTGGRDDHARGRSASGASGTGGRYHTRGRRGRRWSDTCHNSYVH